MEQRTRLPVSWLGFLVAPAPGLLCFAALLTPGSSKPLAAFAVMLLLGLPVAVTGTAAFVTCFHLLDRLRPISRVTSAALGPGLAALLYFPILWVNWKSSGPDSGPPTETIWAYAAHDLNDWLVYWLLVSGIATAAVYHGFAVRKARRKA